MSESNEHKFNKKFLVKLTVFIFFYRFYIMHLDQQGTMIKWMDDVLDSIPDEYTKIKKIEEIVEELD